MNRRIGSHLGVEDAVKGTEHTAPTKTGEIGIPAQEKIRLKANGSDTAEFTSEVPGGQTE